MEFILHCYPVAMIALILIGFLGSWMNPRFKKFLIILCLMTNGVYIVWRFGYTLPVSRPADIVMGVILIATECIGFFTALDLLYASMEGKEAGAGNAGRSRPLAER
ncbi:glycosyl transferase family protein [Bacillus paralicheniformis]|uniref:hypothetical protein n=1 Tax=Bacillus paralicheniformis TaxID=1648923 RepID=UPI000F6DDFDB|nr:hypothetical protein [Bacillus paralicheniformis]VEB21270.1 glycosyl transferase family protein [Bacillus paralicheniformis]